MCIMQEVNFCIFFIKMNLGEKQVLEVKLKDPTLKMVGGIFKIIFRVLLIFLVIVWIGAISSMEPEVADSIEIHYVDWYSNHVTQDQATSNKVAIVPIYGMIANENMGLSDTANSEDMFRMLHKAENDSTIKAVVLKIDSPGGTVIDSEKIAEKVNELKKSKKVYTLMDGMAASGGYFIASQSDKIFAYPETITGSIGVVMELPKAKELMDKIGVDVISIKSGDMKRIGSPYEEMTENEREIFQEMVDLSYERFLNYVVAGRGMGKSKLRELADGRIYSGVQAEENSLIDSTEGLEGIKNQLAQDNLYDYALIEYRVPVNPFEQFFSPMGKVLSGWNEKSNSRVMIYYKM